MKISNKVTPQILTTPSIFQYPITEPEDEKICRICFEESDTDNPLICPCRCAGTIKYIHEKCLKM